MFASESLTSVARVCLTSVSSLGHLVSSITGKSRPFLSVVSQHWLVAFQRWSLLLFRCSLTPVPPSNPQFPRAPCPAPTGTLAGNQAAYSPRESGQNPRSPVTLSPWCCIVHHSLQPFQRVSHSQSGEMRGSHFAQLKSHVRYLN